MPKSNVNNCSQLVRIFALSSCAFLLSDRTQFCSRTVRNFALRPYAILLSDRTQFCSRTVRNFALRPLLVLIFALKPLLVPATYRATVFLLSDRTQFCSRTVRNFALRPYAILLSDRTQFCSRTVRNFALRPLLVLIFALKPLLVPATYRATVVARPPRFGGRSGIKPMHVLGLCTSDSLRRLVSMLRSSGWITREQRFA